MRLENAGPADQLWAFQDLQRLLEHTVAAVQFRQHDQAGSVCALRPRQPFQRARFRGQLVGILRGEEGDQSPPRLRQRLSTATERRQTPDMRPAQREERQLAREIGPGIGRPAAPDHIVVRIKQSE